MKVFICFLLVTLNAIAQDPGPYLRNFDAKVYSLKTKGVKDFVVDVSSDKLTKQINDTQIFGKVEEVFFRVYWTANPERIAIEIYGLPEGFKEAKEELKNKILATMDSLIPLATEKTFSGYKIINGQKAKEFIAKDTSGIATVPSYVLKFDQQDKLIEVVGQKPIGSLTIVPDYKKEAFSDGKWVLKSQTTTSSENGQTLVVKKILEYGHTEGIAVLTSVNVTTEQKSISSNAKTSSMSEFLSFKNYKINEGNALRYFLSEGVRN